MADAGGVQLIFAALFLLLAAETPPPPVVMSSAGRAEFLDALPLITVDGRRFRIFAIREREVAMY